MSLTIKNLYGDIAASLSSLRNDDSPLDHSRNIVEEAASSEELHYGINTGFGILAQTKISPDEVRKLQRNILLSHSVGMGDPMPREITKLMMQLKVHSLGLGYSGVSKPVFHRLLDFIEADEIPKVPSKGSVGASGDLAPLAHMSLPIIGEGEFWSDSAERQQANKVIDKHGWPRIELAAKDGLALINGTQFMAAYGAYILNKALPLLKIADIIAGMSLEALQGSAKPFDERVHKIRPHKGQIAVASNLRKLLEESEILESHRDCGKVQDPYCLRCIPQVHGASRGALDHVIEVFETEINSVTDNPLIFENGDVISGGNFHGQPLALAMDYAAIALAEIASISERRTYLLLEGHDGLPRLLMKETGVNSGFMMPQYTAAALVSENKVLCHPASVDSIPTSLGQEDHVSMGSISATKLLQVFRNVQDVLAIELFTSAQALDFRKPLKSGRLIESAHQIVREGVRHFESDNFFLDDLRCCVDLISGTSFLESIDPDHRLE